MPTPVDSFRTDVRRIEKPWGHELWFALTETYCGKLLVVRAGEELSLQYHVRKEESWYVQSGRARLELGELDGSLCTVEILAGEALHLPAGTVHRVAAIEDTTILEVSTPEVDDVVRLEDRYGRAGASAPSPGR